MKAPASETRSPRTTDTGMGTSWACSSTRRAVTTTDCENRAGLERDVVDERLAAATTTRRSTVSKPSSVTVTRYWPGSSVPDAYVPSALVMISVLVLVASLVILTVTPGSTPPDESLTVPEMTFGVL